MSSLRFLIFFTVLTTLILSSLSFVALRLTGVAPPAWKLPIWGLAILNFVLIMAGAVGGRALPDGPTSTALSTVGYVAMGVFSLVFVSLLAVEIVRLGGGALDRIAGWFSLSPPTDAVLPDPGRRRALAGMANLGALSFAAGASAVAFWRARQPVAVKAVEIPVAGLPASLDGFRIAQLSDIHIGPTIKGDFLAEVVEKVNNLGADMVAITGDLVDGSVAELGRHTEVLADLRSRHGTWFVTGNHEYYSGAESWVAELRRLGLTVLLNEHSVVEHDGGRLVVGGVTDLRAGGILPSHATSPREAIAGAPEADLRLLLAHQPGSVFEAEAAGFDVQLSGHTHGGQYFPGTVLIHLAHPVVKGLERVGKVWVYVSCGTGYWGPPFRLGAAAEITDITLRSAPSEG